jgi:ABC-type transporter Mla subunit MlaD
MNPQRASYFRLGLFTLGAIAIAVAFVVAFGAGKWFRPKAEVETYFNESVQGIDVGTAIKYRGVTVGQVSKIGFTYAVYEQDKPPVSRKPYVMIEAVVYPRELSGRGELEPRLIQSLIDNGLRVQQAAQGLTGAYYLELDFVDPARNPPLPIEWEPANLYIPSARSKVGQLVSGAENLMRKLDSANLDEVVVNLNDMITDVRNALERAQPGTLSSHADELLVELRQTNRQLQAVLSDPAWRAVPRDVSSTLNETRKLVSNDEIIKTVAQMRETLAAIERGAARIDQTVAAREAELPVILDNLRLVTENLRDLTAELRRYPSGALLGEPPRPLTRPEPRKKP